MLKCLFLVLGQDCIVIVDDFAVSKVPSSNGKKYFISSPGAQGRPFYYYF